MKIENNSKSIPIVFPLNGVYENTFFALAESYVLNRLKENNVTLPESLSDLNASDNPILVFYEPIK